MKYDAFDYVIVEKKELDNPSPKNEDIKAKLSHITLVEPGKSFVLPCVDSCVGLVIPFENGSHVVAHIGMHDIDENDHTGQYAISNQKDEIMKLVEKNQSAPLGLNCYGSSAWLQSKTGKDEDALYDLLLAIEEVAENRGNNDFPFGVDCTHVSQQHKASDVYFDPQNNKIKMQEVEKQKKEEKEPVAAEAKAEANAEANAPRPK